MVHCQYQYCLQMKQVDHKIWHVNSHLDAKMELFSEGSISTGMQAAGTRMYVHHFPGKACVIIFSRTETSMHAMVPLGSDPHSRSIPLKTNENVRVFQMFVGEMGTTVCTWVLELYCMTSYRCFHGNFLLFDALVSVTSLVGFDGALHDGHLILSVFV